ncbi:zinc finger MYND domain-containing protein 12 [Biomphalaria glabrata]|nr:Biomphalaria glabrata zinc finger MYND domain-containing protein 12-like [Biomphalaria glabrata]
MKQFLLSSSSPSLLISFFKYSLKFQSYQAKIKLAPKLIHNDTCENWFTHHAHQSGRKRIRAKQTSAHQAEPPGVDQQCQGQM